MKHIRTGFALLFVALALFAAWRAGHRAGIRHAIEDARLSLNGTCIELALDGQLYEHSLTD